MKLAIVSLFLASCLLSPVSTFAVTKPLIASPSASVVNFSAPVLPGHLVPAEISPASIFFFIRTIREQLTLKFAHDDATKTTLKMNFAENRVREAYSAYLAHREDLIIPLMEEYKDLYNFFYDKGLPNGSIEQFTQDLPSLISLYNQLQDNQAKRSIRAVIDRIQEYNWKFLDSKGDSGLVTQLRPELMQACQFIGQQVGNSALFQSESWIYQQKFNQCSARFK